MKKAGLIFILIVIAIIMFAIIWFVNNISNNNNFSNTDIARLSTTINIEQSSTSTTFQEEIAGFSTKIEDDAPGRLNNIRITCNALNNTIVEPGKTFSFNEIVGQPSTKKGYMEAHIIVNDKITTGIGGGNCQVSSTLYNAVLQVSELEVTERHEHGLEVSYVPKGKDACVSYGSLDFKFKNNTNNKILIQISSDDENIVAKLIRI